MSSSIKSGIQLTQACNCALLCEESSKRSKEPPKKVFNKIYERGCFFSQFKFNDNLKLIIFLDTPSKDNRFHQIDYWNKKYKSLYPDVKTISITHPSTNNSDVYNYIDNLSLMKNEKKKEKAIKLFEIAKSTIKLLD